MYLLTHIAQTLHNALLSNEVRTVVMSAHASGPLAKVTHPKTMSILVTQLLTEPFLCRPRMPGLYPRLGVLVSSAQVFVE